MRNLFFATCLLLFFPGSLFAQFQPEKKLTELYELLNQESFLPLLDSCDYYLSQDIISIAFQADLLTLKGNALRRTKRITAALNLHEQALLLRQKNKGTQSLKASSSLLNIANCQLDMGQYEQALIYLNQAKIIKEQHLTPTDKGLVKIYTNLGNVHQLLNQHQLAAEYFKKVLTIDSFSSNQLSPASIAALNGMSTFFIQKLELDSALFVLNQAIELQQNKNNKSSVLLTLYNKQATILAKKGKFEAALQLGQQVLNFYEQLPIEAPNLQATCLQTIGNCYLELSDWQNSVIYFNQALSLFTATPDKVAVQNSLGLLARYQGKNEAAIAYFSEAVGQLLQSGDNILIKSALMGHLYNNLGNCYLDQQNSSAALFYFEKAIELYQQQQLLEEVAHCQNNLGQVFALKKDYPTAANFYKKALNRFQNTPDAYTSYFLLGNLKDSLQQVTAAIDYYHLAFKNIAPSEQIPSTNPKIIDATFPFPYEGIQVIMALANCWQKVASTSNAQKDWAQTLGYAENAIQLIEHLKGKFTQAITAIDLQHTFYQAYNIAITASLALERPHQAYAYATACKGSILKKLVQQNQYRNAHSPDSLIQKEISIEKEMAWLRQRRYQLQKNPFFSFSLEEIAVIDQQLFVLMQQQQVLFQQLTVEQPSSLFLNQQSIVLPIPEIQKKLATDEVLLQYQWANTHLYVFLISTDTFVVSSIPNPYAIEAAVKKLHYLSSQSPVWAATQTIAQFEALVTTSHFLYQQLIMPYAFLLKNKCRIIPDAWLHYLPFESLIVQPAKKAALFNKHHYLLENQQIQYAYEANFPLDSLPQKKFKKTVLAIAPTFEKGNLLAVGPIAESGYEMKLDLDTLYNNQAEAVAIGILFNGTALLDTAATVRNYLQKMANYQIIHFSTHGIINNENPAFSRLTFSKEKTTSAKRLLAINEIQMQPMAADLVVLSACQTANGQLARGEGLLSIGQAFFAAGAKSVIATLWNAEDSETPILMRQFYQYLKDGLTKSEALQKAKLDYIENAGAYQAHPYYWAGFIGIGNAAALDVPPAKNHTWYLSILGIAILAAILIFIPKCKPT